HADRHALALFPTRRSSDLAGGGGHPAAHAPALGEDRNDGKAGAPAEGQRLSTAYPEKPRSLAIRLAVGCRTIGDLFRGVALRGRSEEHTSELQSRENLVCR